MSEQSHSTGKAAAPDARLLTINETASRLGVHPNTVRNCVKTGAFPVVRIGRRIMFEWTAICQVLGIDPRGGRDE